MSCVMCPIKLYVDDTKTKCRVNNEADVERHQEDVENFNTGKFQVLK